MLLHRRKIWSSSLTRNTVNACSIASEITAIQGQATACTAQDTQNYSSSLVILFPSLRSTRWTCFLVEPSMHSYVPTRCFGPLLIVQSLKRLMIKQAVPRFAFHGRYRQWTISSPTYGQSYTFLSKALLSNQIGLVWTFRVVAWHDHLNKKKVDMWSMVQWCTLRYVEG